MSNWRRRNERRAAYEREAEAAERQRIAERIRKDELPMFLRIEEAANIDDVKEILHILADKLGLEG